MSAEMEARRTAAAADLTDLAAWINEQLASETAIVEIAGLGAHMVQHPDGRRYPYGPHELEPAS